MRNAFTTGLFMLFMSAYVLGDAAAGKVLTTNCAVCHGADGNSAVGDFPKLAGQNAKYLLKQMQDIRSGARPIATMTGQLEALTEQQLVDIAAYYAAQTMSLGSANKELLALGTQVYRSGDRKKGMAACLGCHSPTGQGNAPGGFPKLGGQHAQYIASQLRAFRAGAEYDDRGRHNDGESRIMRDVAYRMSDKEIDAVSSYISGLH